MNSFTSSVFPSEANGETEKKLFLSCGRFQSLLVAFRNSKTRRHSEIKQTRPSTKQDFSGEALSTKHRGLTSLTFMQLVPGADRVVRHICIRCITLVSRWCYQSGSLKVIVIGIGCKTSVKFVICRWSVSINLFLVRSVY